MITHTTDLERAQAAEIERLRAALNKIASWHEGPVVTGAFDEPHSAMTARAALGAQPAQPADPVQRLSDEQIDAVTRDKFGTSLLGAEIAMHREYGRAIESALQTKATK
jgi:hypothetical protein